MHAICKMTLTDETKNDRVRENYLPAYLSVEWWT